MKAKSKRRINPTRQYDHLFPRANMTERLLIKGDEKVEETVELMREIVFRTLNQTERIAKLLHRSTTYKTCKAVWDFVYNHIQYEFDSEHQEELRTPARTWADRFRGVDCDCMSIFISSILTNLDIPHDFRISAYKQKGIFGSYCGDWQHVYVIAYDESQKPIIIDCVTDYFNYEVKPCKKKDMAVAELSGVRGRRFSGNGEGFSNLLPTIDKIRKTKKIELSDAEKIAQGKVSKESIQIATDLISRFEEQFKQSAPDLISAFNSGRYEDVVYIWFKGLNDIQKSFAENIPVVGLAIEIVSGIFDFIAQALGFKDWVDLFSKPVQWVADQFSEVPEMLAWLMPTVTTYFTDMCVYRIADITKSHDQYWEEHTAWTVDNLRHKDCDGSERSCWLRTVRNAQKKLFEKVGEMINQNGFFGIDPKERWEFYNWAKRYRRRVRIANKKDLEHVGGKPIDGEDYDNMGSLEDLHTLYTYVYSIKAVDNGYGNAKTYLGKVWHSTNPLSIFQLVNAFRLRIYSPQDALIGYPLFVKYVDTYTGKGEIKPLTKELVEKGYQVTPLEIFNLCEDCFAWIDEKLVIKGVYVKNTPKGFSGFGEEQEYLDLRDVYAEELRIQNESDYAKALAQIYTEQERQEKSNKSWLYLLLLPSIGVGAGALFASFKKS